MPRAQAAQQEMVNTSAAAASSGRAVRVYATACALIVGAVLLTNWPTYSYAVRGGTLPLYYYALPGLLVIPIAFAEPQALARVSRVPLFWWLVAYMLLGILWQIIFQDFSEEPNRQFRVRVLVFLLFVSTAVILSESNRTVVAWLIAGCVLLAGAFNWFDALRPYRFVPRGFEDAAEGRGAGLFINPNIAGSFIIMGTIAALPYLPSRLRAVALTAAVMCLAPTFSRGAFVLAALAIISAIFLGMLRRLQIVLILLALPMLVAAVNVGYDYLMTHSEDRKMQSVVQRLMVLQDVAEEDDSVDTRRDAAARAWELFKQNPLLGAGLGATTSIAFVVGPHNMYIALMAEQGIFGLALYLSFLFLIARAGWRLMRAARDQHVADAGRATIMLALMLAAHSFFSHNVFDEAQGIFLIAFLMAAVMQGQRITASKAATLTAPFQQLRPAPRLMRP